MYDRNEQIAAMGQHQPVSGAARIREHWEHSDSDRASPPPRSSARDCISSLFSRIGALEKLADQLGDRLSIAMPPAEPQKVRPGPNPSTQAQESELVAALENMGYSMDELSARLSDMIRRVQL